MGIKNIALQTVVETPEFIKQAKESMDDHMRRDFIDYIAKNPLGGARIIYYYHDQDMPIYLLPLIKRINVQISHPLKKRHLVELLN